MINKDIEIEKLARQVHDVYRSTINDNGGDYASPYEEAKGQWVRLAKIVFRHQMNPLRFVHSEFMRVPEKLRKRQPRPSQMGRNFSIENYYQHVPKNTDINYHESFRIMRAHLRRKSKQLIPSWYDNHKELLMDPYMNFKAWFRVIMLPGMDPDIMGRYGKHAKTQYKTELGLRIFLEELKDEYDISRLQ